MSLHPYQNALSWFERAEIVPTLRGNGPPGKCESCHDEAATYPTAANKKTWVCALCMPMFQMYGSEGEGSGRFTQITKTKMLLTPESVVLWTSISKEKIAHNSTGVLDVRPWAEFDQNKLFDGSIKPPFAFVAYPAANVPVSNFQVNVDPNLLLISGKFTKFDKVQIDSVRSWANIFTKLPPMGKASKPSSLFENYCKGSPLVVAHVLEQYPFLVGVSPPSKQSAEYYFIVRMLAPKEKKKGEDDV